MAPPGGRGDRAPPGLLRGGSRSIGATAASNAFGASSRIRRLLWKNEHGKAEHDPAKFDRGPAAGAYHLRHQSPGGHCAFDERGGTRRRSSKEGLLLGTGRSKTYRGLG